MGKSSALNKAGGRCFFVVGGAAITNIRAVFDECIDNNVSICYNYDSLEGG